MHVIFLQDYYPFLEGDKVETSTFCGRHEVSWIDKNNFWQSYYVDLLRGSRIIKIIPNT